MTEQKTQYIWDREIKEISENTVTFVDESEMYISDKQKDYLITDEKIEDLTELQKLRVLHVVQDILKIVKDHNVRRGDFAKIFETTIESVDASFKIAVWKAFGTFQEWRHPDYFDEDICVSDIERVMNK